MLISSDCLNEHTHCFYAFCHKYVHTIVINLIHVLTEYSRYHKVGFDVIDVPLISFKAVTCQLSLIFQMHVPGPFSDTQIHSNITDSKHQQANQCYYCGYCSKRFEIWYEILHLHLKKGQETPLMYKIL